MLEKLDFDDTTGHMLTCTKNTANLSAYSIPRSLRQVMKKKGDRGGEKGVKQKERTSRTFLNINDND